MGQCVAVVGTGYWGRNHVRTWAALKDENVIERLIVCDLTKIVLENWPRSLIANGTQTHSH